MAKRIKHVSDLPQWFNLEKYKAASKLDTAGWYEQLIVRHDLLHLLLSHWHGHVFKDDHGEWNKSTIDSLALIRENPIVDIANNVRLNVMFYGGALCELKSKNIAPCYSLGVHHTTVRDLYLTKGNIEQGKQEYANAFFAQFFDKDDWDTPWAYKCTDWIDRPVDFIMDNPGFRVNIQVNLRLPDKVLHDQFKRLLDELRGHLNEAGAAIDHWRKPDYGDWVKFSVLPYLDLKIWEKETGSSISNRVMADAIFLPGEGGEEVVRKTTAKFAKELLTKKHLETLAALAAHEIAERNTV